MFSRLEQLLGEEAVTHLNSKHVLVFGVGGVGGYVIEGLVRSGIGEITIVDNDVVSLSNINRQIIATTDCIDCLKTDVMKERILSINPNCIVHTINMFYLPENADSIDFSIYDYVVDAIDTISSKIELAVRLEELKKPHISCMGTGNKMNPTMLEVSDIYKTSVCPLAKVMRRELKKRHVKHLKVVYSKELPVRIGQRTPSSSIFVPASAGLLIAGEVIKDLLNEKGIV